jgi:hypothetical protein
MGCRDSNRLTRSRSWSIGLALALLCIGLPVAHAATTGKIQGRIVATDNGEPIGFADLLLIPADTTLRRVGGLTHADGTYLLEARPGRYTLQIRALSYSTKRVEGIAIEEGKLVPFSTALAPEALVQEEVVVEAERIQNTEASLLSARKKAASVGDAVSAEQVRKSADRDAAEVLRRVTGLSVSGGKYVFVRGLGERYSSTEVDGVRLASAEQNKRVVPLDLLPANLVDHIVVQKTYTADRPGEFGGGDVQVRTRDFPGQRTWSLSISQGVAEGVTWEDRRTYGSYKGDRYGFGASDREIPASLDGVQLPPENAANRSQLRKLAKLFDNIWETSGSNTIPAGSYSLTYGDQFKLFGRPLGVIQSWSLSRSFDEQDESQRLFVGTDTTYDYAVKRWTETAQLGGLSGFSYRLTPSHSIHLRGLMSNSADDEVRVYQGDDHNRDDAFTNRPVVNRNTRLKYVQRNVLSGSVEGRHAFSAVQLDWKFGRSRARREMPDLREFNFQRFFYFEGDTAHWVLGGTPYRHFGKMTENGWGTTVTGSVPYRLGGLGSGKVVLGFDRQTKSRDNFYRRFEFFVNPLQVNTEAPIERILADTSVILRDVTYNQPFGSVDNYRAHQRVEAGFLSVDVPFGRRLRGNFGVRVESGFQNVQSFALFNPSLILREGELGNIDVLPSGNLTWAFHEAINLRVAGSQTVSRPDLNELSPSPFLEYISGFQVTGNPDLHRALLDNYDVRIEAFPGISEVLAVGVFYKRLRDPIEQSVQGGSAPILTPINSDFGRNRGIEIEARASLGRLWKPLQRLAVNSNASFIDSKIELPPNLAEGASPSHPLQGQADYIVNVALTYAAPYGIETALLLNATGERLQALGFELPDIYLQPFSTLDATVNARLFSLMRVKLSAKNLLDPTIREQQGPREYTRYKTGRAYSIAFSLGL